VRYGASIVVALVGAACGVIIPGAAGGTAATVLVGIGLAYLMERTRIYQALPGVRGRQPVDLAALEQLIVRFSQLVIEQPWIKEIDINPLLASGQQLIALDARVVLHPAGTPESELPRPAIRPYPLQYVSTWTNKNGVDVSIRPIRPEDEPMIAAFHQTLSDESVYNRYFHTIQLGQRVAHERLTRNCFIDYDREMALAVELTRAEPRAIIAVGRLSKVQGANEAEVAAIVSDAFQNLGLGSELVRLLIGIAREEKLDRLVATILPGNRAMQKVFRNLGFQLHYSAEEEAVAAELKL